MRRDKTYKEHLTETLQTPEDIAEYVNAVIDEQDVPTLMLALRDVVDAQGIGKVAEQANLNRQNVYRMLSEHGNPTISSLMRVLYVLGLSLRVEPTKEEISECVAVRATGATVSAVASTVANTSLGDNAEIQPVSRAGEGIDYESTIQTNAESLAA